METVTAQPVTTFLLLKSHEPACPPSITDAGSQAGQAFNQVLRYIAGCPGFQSQLFGWPAEPASEDVDLNEWMASIMPGSLGIFINWDDDRTANNFLSPSSMSQAFQGLTSFFEVPQTSTATPSRALDKPRAFNIAWRQGDAAKLLNSTKLPLQISLSESQDRSGELAQRENDDPQALSAIGTLIDSAGDATSQVSVQLRHISYMDSDMLADQESGSLMLNLMRTRYCSRLKEDLYDMIRARRAD